MKWLFRGEWDDKCANLWLDEWGGIFSWHEKMVSQLSNYVVRFLHLFSLKPKNKIFENIKTWKLWMWQKNLTIWHTTYYPPPIYLYLILEFFNYEKLSSWNKIDFILVWTKYFQSFKDEGTHRKVGKVITNIVMFL